MGTAANHGRRSLVDVARQAVERVNECNVAVADVQKRHNALTVQVSDDIAGHKTRMDGLGAWCSRNEQSIVRESTRLTRTRIEVGQVGLEFENFTIQTFWQRLRWLFTGRWDRPAREGEGIKAETADAPTSNAYDGVARAMATLADAKKAMAEVPLRQAPAPMQYPTTLGPRVLP